MKLSADYHTHSKHSRFWHGKNSIIEMAYRANELGLREIAITDHAFKHLFRTNKEKLYDARLTIDDLNKWSQTKILLGIEADILDENGTLDVDLETLALIDVLIIGYHRMIKTDFASYFGKQENTPEAKQKATNAYLNAIAKYPVSIVAHLDSILTTDLYQIGKACAEKGIAVEINNRHTDWTQEQMDELLASGCGFVLSSDAHCAEDVGNVQHALDIMNKYNIPSEKIINVDFEYSEMTDEHKELNRLYQEYQRKQEKIAVREKVFQEQKDFSEIKLSKEMEDALLQIEREQRGYVSPAIDKKAQETVASADDTSANEETSTSEETLSESESSETPAPEKDEAEANTTQFLNAVNRLTEVFSPETNAESEAQTNSGSEAKAEDGVETEPEENPQAEQSTETEEKETIGKTKPKAPRKPRSELKKGKAEININTPSKKAEAPKSEEVKSMFSVNAETEKSKKERIVSKEISPAKAKPNTKKNKAGAFVSVSRLTGENDTKK